MNAEQLKAYILKWESVLNMRAVCDRAGVNYSTYRGWRYQGRSLSETKLEKLAIIIHSIGNK